VPVPTPRSPLWIVVLGLACEEPMHPYRMQALIRERGKEQIANVAQRNSVYQTISALLRAGLIEVHGTARDENRPERTLYEATDEGRRALRAWIRAGLSTPAREFPEFPAVLSTLYGVRGAADLGALLGERVTALEARLAELETALEGASPDVPRVFLLETEYLAAMVRAERAWLRQVIADIEQGRLTFPSAQELRRLAKRSAAAESSTPAARRASRRDRTR
jgi:DNA-binding PadR family transcriptional regulator